MKIRFPARENGRSMVLFPASHKAFASRGVSSVRNIDRAGAAQKKFCLLFP